MEFINCMIFWRKHLKITVINSPELMSFEKAVEIFGKHVEQEVTTKNGEKVQELVWLVEAGRTLRANYILMFRTFLLLR